MTGAALTSRNDDPPDTRPLTLPRSKKLVIIEAGSATT